MKTRSLSPMLMAVLIAFISSSCTGGWGPPVKEVHPGAKEVMWDKQSHRWVLAPAPKNPSEDSEPQPHNRQSSAVVQEIRVPAGVKESQQGAPVQLERGGLSYKDYIKEKFKGKKIIFPEELVKKEIEKPAFRLGPEDILQINVWKAENLSLEVEVRRDGKVTLPLVGEIEVAGLQVHELEDLLKRKYAAYVERPFVSVTVKEINSLKVFITGAVRFPNLNQVDHPAGIRIQGDGRLTTALSQVEILPDADLREAFMVRKDTIIPLDLLRLLKDGDLIQNVLLHPGDTVVVPGFIKEIFVLGEVAKPGSYKVPRQTYLLDALALAGGHKPDTAALNLAYVSRGGKVLPVDLKKLVDEADLDHNILLEDKDTIYIPSSRLNKVFVLGEINSPGVYRFVDKMDIVEAIAQAGDFPISANRKQVVVVRGGVKDPKVYAVNAYMMIRGYTHEKFFLEPGDTVYVPRSIIGNWNAFVTQLLPTVQSFTLGYSVASIIRR